MTFIKRFVLLLMLALAIPATSQAQVWDGPGEQPVSYSGPEVIGDGSNAHGGIPPIATRVAPIPSSFDISLWKISLTAPVVVPGDGHEPKFRTHCNPAFAGRFDFILYPGQQDAGHDHLFFGNTGVSPNSNYASLRTTGGSTCGGGLLNRSAYWIPCLELAKVANTNDSNKCLKPDVSIVYYNGESQDEAAKMIPPPTGFSYVGGVDPADITNSYNNARAGQAVYSGMSWKCESGAAAPQSTGAPNPGAYQQPYFKNNAWSMVCPVGDRLIMEVDMPGCIDGKNLSSPNARKHVIQAINGRCPNGWWRIPTFQLFTYYSVTNAEIASGRLYLSSDRMGSNSASWAFPGQTGHADWFGAWDPTIINTWSSQCIGMNDVPGQPQQGTTRDCGNSEFGNGTAGITAQPAPDGSRNPQVDFSIRQNLKGVYRFYAVRKPVGVVAGAHTHGM